MPKDSLIALANSTIEEQSNLQSMVQHWPSAITATVIREHFPHCKACLLAHQKKLAFFRPSSDNTSRHESRTPKVSTYHTPGQLGQVDIWGPYHVGRSGNTHMFTLIDAFSQYAVSLPCTNKPGELPKLLSQAIGIFYLWV